MIKSKMGYWIVYNTKTKEPLPSSIKFSRDKSISAALEDTTIEWEEAEKLGWVCKKVNISFELSTKP